MSDSYTWYMNRYQKEIDSEVHCEECGEVFGMMEDWLPDRPPEICDKCEEAWENEQAMGAKDA